MPSKTKLLAHLLRIHARGATPLDGEKGVGKAKSGARLPRKLYYGTDTKDLIRFFQFGISSNERDMIPLSDTPAGAAGTGPGARSIVLAIDTIKARRQGQVFVRSHADIWMTAQIPAGSFVISSEVGALNSSDR